MGQYHIWLFILFLSYSVPHENYCRAALSITSVTKQAFDLKCRISRQRWSCKVYPKTSLHLDFGVTGYTGSACSVGVGPTRWRCFPRPHCSVLSSSPPAGYHQMPRKNTDTLCLQYHSPLCLPGACVPFRSSMGKGFVFSWTYFHFTSLAFHTIC